MQKNKFLGLESLSPPGGEQGEQGEQGYPLTFLEITL